MGPSEDHIALLSNGSDCSLKDVAVASGDGLSARTLVRPDDLGYLARKVASRWHRLPGPQGGAVSWPPHLLPRLGRRARFSFARDVMT